MEDDTPHVKNIQEYHNSFRTKASQIRFAPRQSRICNDKICYVIFILITLTFIIVGAYFIRSSQFNHIFKSAIQNNEYYQYTSYTSLQFEAFNLENIKPAIPIIAGMMLLTIVMSAIFLCLLVKFPKATFIMMLFIGFILFAGVAGILFYIGALIPAIIMTVLITILVIILCCTWKKIKTGLVLLNIASKFLIQKPSVFFVPIFVLIFVLAFQCYWAFSLAGITIYKSNAQTQSELSQQKTTNSIISFFWAFFNIFYSFFFYYCISFLIATASSIYYYNLSDNFLFKGTINIIKSHIGSFTFASILVTIVSMTRQYTEKQARSTSGCGISTVCILMLGCCIKFMEDILETLNHNAIITMAITGQSYFDSAKSALSLIFDNFPLFFLVDLMSRLVTISGMIFICGIPSILGFILLQSTVQNPDDTTSQIIGTIIIVIFSMLIGAIFLSVLSQTLSCIFILFCLDRRFVELGYPAPDQAPKQIRDIFQQLGAYVGGDYNEHYDEKKIRNEDQWKQEQTPYGHETYQSSKRGQFY